MFEIRAPIFVYPSAPTKMTATARTMVIFFMWCNWLRNPALTGKSREDQLMIAGRMTVAPSLNGAIVSCIM